MSFVLAVNAGSSSLKVSLFDTGKDTRCIKTASVSSVPEFIDSASREDKIPTNLQGNISHICHRVVHGGDFRDAMVVSKEVYDHLEELSDLAPLHNVPALEIIRQCEEAYPKAKSIAFFDTAFHRTIPPHIYTYPINQEVAEQKKLRKYGFHGLSYSFIVRTMSSFLQKSTDSLNLIVLHLGSGASACAVLAGKSLDTTMGLTPLDGLPGATRSGGVDPSLIFHYTSDASRMSHAASEHMHVTQAEEILNKQSGWSALAGTKDFGEIVQKMQDSENAKLAFNLVVDRISAVIGSYFVKLKGKVDGLVFAGGVGEHSAELRRVVVENVTCLGTFGMPDPDLNEQGRIKEVVTRVGENVYVCKTDEQSEMVAQCMEKKEF